jgi:hypothetical protein
VTWPVALTFIRHGESAYNVLKAKKEADVAFQELKARFDREFADARDDRWVSDGLLTLARQVWKTIANLGALTRTKCAIRTWHSPTNPRLPLIESRWVAGPQITSICFALQSIAHLTQQIFLDFIKVPRDI